MTTLPPTRVRVPTDKNDYPVPKKLLCKCTASPRLSVRGIATLLDQGERILDRGTIPLPDYNENDLGRKSKETEFFTCIVLYRFTLRCYGKICKAT